MPSNWDRITPESHLIGRPHIPRQDRPFVDGYCVFSDTAFVLSGVPLCGWQTPSGKQVEGIAFFTNENWHETFPFLDAIVVYEGKARYTGVCLTWLELMRHETMPDYALIAPE